MTLNTKVLRSSFDLVVERDPFPTKRFYDKLFEQSPQLVPLFRLRDRTKQENMLSAAISSVFEQIENPRVLNETLRKLGAKHVAYGATEEMYPLFGDALIATLADICGEDWSEEAEKAWTAAYRAVSKVVLEGARDVVAQPTKPAWR